MKQTAVEWFEDQVGHNSLMGLKEFNEIFEKAKEMEKEQMHAEYMRGWKDGVIKQGPPAPPLDRKIYK
jgi:hypothetical protein